MESMKITANSSLRKPVDTKDEHGIRVEVQVIFKECYSEFCLLSYSYVACMDQAKDIVQDVFVKILVKDQAAEILNLKAYIWRAVKNTSLKHLERSKKLEPLNQNALIIASEEEKPDDELRLKMQDALEKLPPQCKNVFELCVVKGQKYNSTADSLGISVNTVKTQMKKAYRILRNNLGNVHYTLFFFLVF
ncbi:RNA polymerase sigma-70 factor, ECF subfamily [Zobellia uliginosa]|uniref:RNA polymerase sigma-70 factor, ECF subfamily n=2 Tax=Zobellia uliginosa TaxID=143224 RepID=A0ABY1KTH3_9FLAO|nr:RNA polymerase sigma-70 factor, ECF subfamily [Zobellia uliginosa]